MKRERIFFCLNVLTSIGPLLLALFISPFSLEAKTNYNLDFYFYDLFLSYPVFSKEALTKPPTPFKPIPFRPTQIKAFPLNLTSFSPTFFHLSFFRKIGIAFDEALTRPTDSFYIKEKILAKEIASFGLTHDLLAEASANLPKISGISATQVDPFYLRLLEEGKSLYNQGKIADALKNLEIAAFGFVEDRAHLLEAYVYLVIGYYRLRDIERAAYFLSEIERLNIRLNLAQIPLDQSTYNEFLITESLLWRLGIAALTGEQRKYLVREKEIKIENKEKKGEAQDEAARSGRIFESGADSPTAIERVKIKFSLAKLLAGKLPPRQPTSTQEMIKLKEAHLADPQNGVVSLRLAMVYEELGQWPKAGQVLKNYLKFVPDCAAHRFELGRVLFELQKPKEALAELQKAAEVFTGDIEFDQIKEKILETLKEKWGHKHFLGIKRSTQIS